MKTIYLTGTIIDMEAEYEAIKNVTMPIINEFLKESGEEAVLGGFTDTSDDEGCRKELKNCFRELKKGDVYYVSLFGERYGDIPPADVTDGFLEKVGLHVDDNVNGRSVTEIEVLYAALADKDKSLFYFREPFGKKALSNDIYKKFVSGFGEGRKVKKLKSLVKGVNGIEIHGYSLETENGDISRSSAESFASRVAEDLKVMIAADMAKKAKKTEEQDEEPKETTETPVKAPLNITKVETPVWDSVKNGEKYNPEKLRAEAIALSKNAMALEQTDPDEAGDLYDDAMEIFRRIQKDILEGGKFNDELKEDQTVLIADECVRDMGLTYFAFARIEFNAKNFDGAAAWGKQALESLTKFQKKYNKIQAVVDMSNVWMLMGAALANAGETTEAIQALCATMSCYDGMLHNKGFKATEDFSKKYQSVAQLAHTICINDKSGECAKTWLKFCQQQSLQLSKMGDNAAMINYVNFSMAVCENQIYGQNNKDNMYLYLNMIHEITQFFLRDKNEAMMKILVDKGLKLLEVAGDDVKVVDIVCSMLTLQANLFFTTGKQEEALGNYDKVIEMRSSYKESPEWSKRLVIAADYARRSSAYTELDRLDEAKAGYDEAISIIKNIEGADENEKLYGEMASAYMNRSVALGKLGETDAALESIKTASDIVEGKKLTQPGLMIMRRRIRRMYSIAKDKNAIQMYDSSLMEKAKAEITKLHEADEFIKKNDFEAGATRIESALETLKELNVIDIVLPSEAYTGNLVACASIYMDKLNNKTKAEGLLRQAAAVAMDMERDGLRLNENLVKNLKARIDAVKK